MESDKIVQDFFSNYNRYLIYRNKYQPIYQKKIQDIWGQPLTLFEAFAEMTFNYFYEQFQNKKDASPLEQIVVSILSKVYLSLDNILLLLRDGFPDGAMSIARSLHEHSVTLLFIIKHADNQDLIQRFEDFTTIEAYKDLLSLKNFYEIMNYNFNRDSELNELMVQKEVLLKKYGKDFKKDWGWSFNIINPNEGFYGIEKNVGGDSVRIYYKMGCHTIHPSPNSISFSLGNKNNEDGPLISGPSIHGLSLPAHFSLISLSAISKALASFLNNDYATTYHNAFHSIISNIIEEFSICFMTSLEQNI
ncbi:MAG: DUF5677 domain-containing protein [Christensenellales bacterium]